MELRLISEIRQVWISVNNDFLISWPQEVREVGLSDPTWGPHAATAGREGECNGCVAGGLSAWPGSRGSCHWLVSMSTTVFSSHRVTDVSLPISSTTLICIKFYFYFTTSSVPSFSSEGHPRQVITIWVQDCTNINMSDQAIEFADQWAAKNC